MLIPIVTFAAVTLGSLTVGVAVLHRRAWNVLDPTVVFWFGYSVFYGVANLWFVREVSRDGVFDRGGFWFDAASRNDLYYLNTVAALTAVYGLAVAIGMFGLGPLASRAGIGHIARKVGGGPDLVLGILIPLSLLHWCIQLGLLSRVGMQLPSAVFAVPKVCCLALNARLTYEAALQMRLRPALVAGAVLAWSLIAAFLTGMNSEGVYVLLAGFVGFMLAIRRPWPVVAAVVIALPLFVVAQSWKKLNRAVLWDDTVKRSLVERMAVLGESALSLADPDGRDQSEDGMGRLCTAIPMLQTLELMRRNEGIPLNDGLVTPHVPRALWPTKPLVLTGTDFYVRISGNENSMSSSSPGQPAEAFMYGGWIGVASIGLCVGLLGAMTGALVQELWLHRKAASLGAVILMSIVFGKCENWLWTYLPTVLNCIVTLIVLQWISRWGIGLYRGGPMRANLSHTQGTGPPDLRGFQ